MSASTIPSSLPPLHSPPFPGETVPPLENGDRLTRKEFFRRWEAMPKLRRAELIEGVVYMAAAVRLPQHARPHGWLFNLLSTYAMRTGVDFGDNAIVQLDPTNAPQPDVCLFLPRQLGGLASVNAEGYLEGPPDLVAEVAASTTSIDMHEKFHVYRRNKVREYIVWRVLDGAVDWFLLGDDGYAPLLPDGGRFKSRVFPGLWLDPAALLAYGSVRLHAALEEGMNTPEYAEFARAMAPYRPAPTRLS